MIPGNKQQYHIVNTHDDDDDDHHHNNKEDDEEEENNLFLNQSVIQLPNNNKKHQLVEQRKIDHSHHDLMMMIEDDNTGLFDSSGANGDDYMDDDEEEEEGDEDDDEGGLLPSSGRRRNRIGKQFHRRQQSTSQRKLRIYYALMLAFVLFVIVSMIVVSIKVLRMDSGGGGDGEKFQLSFKITWSPSSCYISNGTLAKNCPLPSNQFKLPDYTQGFIITELKRAQEDDPDSLCKKSAVKFEQDKLSTDIRSRLNRYWPSLVNPDSSIDLWKSHYERYGRCVPTVLPVNDQNSYEQDKYFSKALELREKVYKSVTENMDKILKSKGQQQVNSTIQDQFPTETISYDTLKRILRIPIDSTVGSFSVPANYVTAYSDCEYIRDQFVFQSLVVCTNEKGILEECQPEYQKYLANFDARCKSPNVTFPLIITKKKKK